MDKDTKEDLIVCIEVRGSRAGRGLFYQDVKETFFVDTATEEICYSPVVAFLEELVCDYGSFEVRTYTEASSLQEDYVRELMGIIPKSWEKSDEVETNSVT